MSDNHLDLKIGDLVGVKCLGSQYVGQVVGKTPTGMLDVAYESGDTGFQKENLKTRRFGKDGWTPRSKGPGFVLVHLDCVTISVAV